MRKGIARFLTIIVVMAIFFSVFGCAVAVRDPYYPYPDAYVYPYYPPYPHPYFYYYPHHWDHEHGEHEHEGHRR